MKPPTAAQLVINRLGSRVMETKKPEETLARNVEVTGNIKAVLRRKFPGATQKEIQEAADELANVARRYYVAMNS